MVYPVAEQDHLIKSLAAAHADATKSAEAISKIIEELRFELGACRKTFSHLTEVVGPQVYAFNTPITWHFHMKERIDSIDALLS